MGKSEVGDNVNGSGRPRFPRYYPKLMALKKLEELEQTKDPAAMTIDSPVSAAPAEGSGPNGTPNSANRPKRRIKQPMLFTEYRQDNELIKEKEAARNSGGELDDPYKDRVYWVKYASHPHWPSRVASEEELNEMSKSGNAKASRPDRIGVVFLGSNTTAVVKKDDLLDYSTNYEEYTKKKRNKEFEIGLEEADAIAWRYRQETDDPRHIECRVCRKRVEPKFLIRDQSQVKKLDVSNPETGIECERCLYVIHTKCQSKSGKNSGDLIVGFNGRKDPCWFCSHCCEVAPYTIAERKGVNLNKKKRKSNANANAYEPSVTSETTTKKSRRGGGDGNSIANDTKSKELSSRQNHATSRTERSERRDIHDDYCFVCGDGGVLRMCDFSNCHRAYHKYCLDGNVLFEDDEDEDEDETWICPWHYCAECGAPEDRSCGSAKGTSLANVSKKRTVLSAPPLTALKSSRATVPVETASTTSSSSSSSSSLTMMEGTTGEEDDPMDHPPRRNTRTRSSSSSSSMKPSKVEVDNGTNDDDEEDEFIRCLTCPLALCSKHTKAPTVVFTGKTHVLPDTVERPHKKSYFKCTHCVGCVVNNVSQSASPLVSLGRTLQKTWSRMVNGNDFVVAPFVVPIADSDVPKEALVTWKTLEGPKDLIQVRHKIWTLQYSSWQEFADDVESVAKAFDIVYGTSNVTLKQASRTLTVLLDTSHRAFASKLTIFSNMVKNLDESHDVGVQMVRDLMDKSPFRAGGLYPTVQMQGKVKGPVDLTKLKRRSPEEWERYFENISYKGGQDLADPGAKPARDEARGVADALLLAAHHASYADLNNHLAPSRAELEDMLEQQSLVLRSALRSTALLRDAVQKTYRNFDQIHENDTDNQITLGEMRLAAEYRLANRCLKERNVKLTQLLDIEREARKQAERKLQEYEKKQQQQ